MKNSQIMARQNNVETITNHIITKLMNNKKILIEIPGAQNNSISTIKSADKPLPKCE